MERRLQTGWTAILVLLVPLILQLPRQASGVPFNYLAHCHDMDSGRNSLFKYTVRQFEDRMASTYGRHFSKSLEAPQGVSRPVRMFYRLRSQRDTAPDIDQLVGEMEASFLERLERLERHCNSQIHG